MIAAYARDAATGEPAGGGIATIPVGGLTEIAGIGVREAFPPSGHRGRAHYAPA